MYKLEFEWKLFIFLSGANSYIAMNEKSEKSMFKCYKDRIKESGKKNIYIVDDIEK